MGKRRPERDEVERLIKENRRRKAHDIAGEIGLIDKMGYDKAVDYIRRVRKEMKKSGDLPRKEYIAPSNADRMADIDKLFELRQGKPIDKAVLITMLKLNCYYRLQSEDDDVHLMAIDDTYAKNRELITPVAMSEAISICEFALERYMDSRNEEKNEQAKAIGYPGAGLHYSTSTLLEHLKITPDEEKHMISIRRDE